MMFVGMGDGFRLGAARYHFLMEDRWLRRPSDQRGTSSIASGSSFLSREFSSSSDRNCRASDTSSPPKFDLHLKNVAERIP